MADTSLVFNILAKDKASKTFGKLEKVAAATGLAVGAALALNMVTAFDQEKAADRLAAQVGAAPWAAEAGAAAGDLYADAYGESLGQVGDAVRAVMQGGLLGGDATEAEIEKITAKALSLSNTFEQDVGATARAAAQMIRTGLADDAGEALDILTRGFQNTGDLAGDLLDTYSEYGTQFRKLGLDGQTATGLLVQGLKAGARDVDTVADAIKEFSIRAIDGSTLSAEGFKALGLNAKQMGAQIAAGGSGAEQGLALVLDKLKAIDDPVKRDAAAVALFGTKAEDLGQALFALDPSTAADALGKVEGAAADLDKTLNDNAATSLEGFKRQVQQALIDKLAQALPHIQSVIAFLAPYSGLIVPIVGVLGGLAAVVWTVIQAKKAWAAAQLALNIVMAANPIVLIILAIVGLVAAVVWLWKNVEGFRNFWKKAFQIIGGAVSAVFGWVKRNWPLLLAILTGPIGIAVLAIAKNWDKIKAGASAAKKWILDRFTGLVSWFKNLPGAMGRALSSVGRVISAPFRAAFQAVKSWWNSTVGGFGFDVPGWVPMAGGKSFRIPFMAKGGTITAAGLAVVGDAGPEVLSLPRGASVHPLDRMGGAGGGGLARVLLEIRSSGSRLDDFLVRLLREAIRERGGDPQIVLSGG